MVANLLTHSNLLRVELPVVEPITERLPLWLSVRGSAITGRYLKLQYHVAFMNANKMKTPLLLVHGEADNNWNIHFTNGALFPSIKRLSTSKNGYLT
jgi:hypothetical protein